MKQTNQIKLSEDEIKRLNEIELSVIKYWMDVFDSLTKSCIKYSKIKTLLDWQKKYNEDTQYANPFLLNKDYDSTEVRNARVELREIHRICFVTVYETQKD